MREPVKVTASLEQASTRKDGSVKLIFGTPELDSEKMAALFDLKNEYGWLIFAANGTPEVEIPEAPAPEFKDEKSPSLRLRNVLFIEWKQLGTKLDFETYYRRKMEGFIDSIKEHLEPMSA